VLVACSELMGTPEGMDAPQNVPLCDGYIINDIGGEGEAHEERGRKRREGDQRERRKRWGGGGGDEGF